MGEIDEIAIDKAARHLRETMQAGKRLTPWDQMSKARKRKWLALSAGTLEASGLVDTHPIKNSLIDMIAVAEDSGWDDAKTGRKIILQQARAAIARAEWRSE